MREYFYSWNAPRKAVGAYQADESERGIRYLTPEGKRKFLSAMELAETDEKPDRSKAARRRLASLPHYVRNFYARKLEQMDAKGKKAADNWLLNTFERHVLSRIDHVNDRYLPNATLPAALLPLRNEFFRLLWAGKKELKRLAHSLADILQNEFIREVDFQYERTADPHFSTLSGYGRIGFLASHLNTAVPGWTAYCNEELEGEDAIKCVARLQSPQWWLNRLRRMHARWREHLMIVTGYVQAKSAPYSSEPCVQEWQAQKKANREYLNAMELEEQDTGERLSLADKVNGSIANPAIRRAELMVRMRGFEDLAKLEGLAGDFYTLTAPSAYHSTQKSGRRNDKFNGSSPRDTQRYLCKVWSKTRAAWKRKGIRVFGFRVVEPHHDATPHWHLLLFMRPEHAELARAIFRKYALKEDGGEAGAEENRFKVVPIEEEQGSATGYIAKYIAKNIDGYALDGERDHESGASLRDCAAAVSAWASRWHIRQFQFIGGAPVTVWRELRRITEGEGLRAMSETLADAREAADRGDWAAYVNAQGGPLVRRDELAVRSWYQPAGQRNSWGEEMTRIKGVYLTAVGAEKPLLTRLVSWKLVPKRKEEQARFAVDNASWSSVINCTQTARRPDRLAPLNHGDPLAVKNLASLPQNGFFYRQNSAP